MVTCILLISYFKYNLHDQIFKPILYKLGHLDNYNEALDTTPDTSFRRITRFLEKNNFSACWYELGVIPNRKLEMAISKTIGDIQKDHDRQLFNIRHGKKLKNGCRQSCCWSQIQIPQFYNGEQDRFPSVLDRLSHIDFKFLADMCIMEIYLYPRELYCPN